MRPCISSAVGRCWPRTRQTWRRDLPLQCRCVFPCLSVLSLKASNLNSSPQLDAMLAKDAAKVDKVLNFEVPDQVLVERVTGRWIHPDSGRSYHTKFAPPKVPGKDDVSLTFTLRIILSSTRALFGECAVSPSQSVRSYYCRFAFPKATGKIDVRTCSFCLLHSSSLEFRCESVLWFHLGERTVVTYHFGSLKVPGKDGVSGTTFLRKLNFLHVCRFLACVD